MIAGRIPQTLREMLVYHACARASRFLVALSFRVPPHRTGILREVELLQRRATIRAHTARVRVQGDFNDAERP